MRRYLACVRETRIEVILVHPVLQITDPEGTDLIGAGGLRRSHRLRWRLGRWSPHLRGLRLRGHHHVGLLLLLLLLWVLLVGLLGHAGSWLHHLLQPQIQQSKSTERKDRETKREKEKNHNNESETVF